MVKDDIHPLIILVSLSLIAIILFLLIVIHERNCEKVELKKCYRITALGSVGMDCNGREDKIEYNNFCKDELIFRLENNWEYKNEGGELGNK